ncbi:YcaO-like family protein [Actinospica robiniae]|uniref:YcaO-like family protein n=1 Tax=Actinospica robiniae TaxID=304901 RepID=UPI0009FDC50B|nr:YcaO-like family protein [Actinospica robiniae]
MTPDAPAPSLEWLATAQDKAKLRLPGTYRAKPPEATSALARRAAARVGVTRLADVTRLDTIGIPTYQAIRPTARTVAVSQGKGATAELAKLSALMESIELWHAEQPPNPVVRASARELDGSLGYPVDALALALPSLWHDALELDWVGARSLADGMPTLVPADVVGLSMELRDDWHAPGFFASTNGLASGNTLVEATLHALYEVIERDASTAALRDGGDLGVPVDPRSLGSPMIEGLCDQVERARVHLAVRLLPTATGMPCFLAWMCDDDYPTEMFGFGCHLNPEIALSRAITEAAQTRLTYIAGARDDLDGTAGSELPPAHRPRPTALAGIKELISEPVEHASLLEDLAHAVMCTAAAFGRHPLVVDLSHEEIGVPVVKVIVPGARISPEVL